MKRHITALFVAFLSVSSVLAFVPTDVSGSTIHVYTNALLPDVYVADDIYVNGYDEIYSYSYDYNEFPRFCRAYPAGMKDDVISGLKNGVLLDAPDATGDAVLFVFAYEEPSNLVIYIGSTRVLSGDLQPVIGSEASFYLYSGQSVKLTVGSMNENTMMCIGTGGYNSREVLVTGTNEFSATAPGYWRIYDRNAYNYSDHDLYDEIFLSFSIEIEDMPVNSAVPGYAMLSIGAACIGLFYISAKRQRV